MMARKQFSASPLHLMLASLLLALIAVQKAQGTAVVRCQPLHALCAPCRSQLLLRLLLRARRDLRAQPGARWPGARPRRSAMAAAGQRLTTAGATPRRTSASCSCGTTTARAAAACAGLKVATAGGSHASAGTQERVQAVGVTGSGASQQLTLAWDEYVTGVDVKVADQ